MRDNFEIFKSNLFVLIWYLFSSRWRALRLAKLALMEVMKTTVENQAADLQPSGSQASLYDTKVYQTPGIIDK